MTCYLSAFQTNPFHPKVPLHSTKSRRTPSQSAGSHRASAPPRYSSTSSRSAKSGGRYGW
ncbi:hypothetical protein AVEN_33982-1, partial [Araneus ventricosus]